jgi:TP901 family phage tail tape measure protein
VGTLTSNLKLALIDDVSRKAGVISKALALAEKQTRALATASKAGLSDRMATQLQRLGTGARDIERVTEAWQRYSRAQGLAASSSNWTKDQARGVKEWERANLAAIKRVQDQHARPSKGRAAVARKDEGGLSAGQGAMLGAAAGRAGILMRAAPVVAVGAAMYKATTAAMSFEEVMYEVQKATNSNADGLQRYSTAILDMSTKTGKTASELGGILASAGFAGRPTDELLAFTNYAAKATSAWGTTAEATGQALAEIGNIYQANQARIEAIADAINSVADNSASKETDLLDFLRRSGAQGKILGISAEQTMAFGAALKEVGVQSEVAATGFNALLTKLSTGADDDDWNKQLKDLGINTKSFTATLKKDAPAAIRTLLAQINKIDDGTKKMSVLKDLFGQEYADDIARLAGNLGGLDRMLALVADKSKFLGSVDQSFKLLTEKDYNRVARFNAQMVRLSISVGGPLKAAFGAAADQASRFFESFQEGGAGAKVVDAINAASKRYVTNQIARQEASGSPRLDYDPETRKAIDQQKIEVERKRVDDKLSDYDRQIAEKKASFPI